MTPSRLLLASALFAAAVPASAAPAGVAAPISDRFAKPGDETPDFQKHVVPLLGRLGCNGRACHGSFQGKGGFQLSLFGYDFDNDHKQIAGDDASRIDAETPEYSLLLMKPTLDEPHGGGKRLDVGSWQYNVLRRWVEAGAPNRPDASLKLTRLEVSPSELLFDAAGKKTPLTAVAVWSDGAREDVTALCRFQSNDPAVAEVDANGVVTAAQMGDTHVVAFYDAAVVPVPVLRPVSPKYGPKYPEVATRTKVDELIAAKLSKLGIVPSEVCTDEEFLRRVSIDLTGTLPPAWEVEAFVADGSPDKRRRKIDDLLETPAYAAWWTTRLSDWTGNNADFANIEIGRDRVAQDWFDWIEKRVAANVPYDEIAEGLVLATSREPGESYRDYCENMRDVYAKDAKAEFADRDSMPHYWARTNFRTTEDRAIGFAYTFLGLRIQCAQCHKHPFDQWTQDDFQKFEGFFSRVSYNVSRDAKPEYDAMIAELTKGEKKNGNQLRNELGKLVQAGTIVPMKEVFVLPSRAAARPAKGGKGKKAQRNVPAAEGRVLGGETVDLNGYADAREPLMAWLRSPENPYFARAFVNRVWENDFGAGIVNPPDDLSLANPPSNAPLLDHLAKGFVASGYDMKWVHREILNSDAYQRSWRPNETNRGDARNFSRAVPRRLPAEAAYDALVIATSSEAQVKALLADPSQRAIGVAGSGKRYRGGTAGYALSVFGRSIRESNCDCDRSDEASLLQTVYLQNDQEVLRRLSTGKGTWIGELAASLGDSAKPKETAAEGGDRRAAGVRFKALQKELAEIAAEVADARWKGDGKAAAKLVGRAAEVRKKLAAAKAARKDDADREDEPRPETAKSDGPRLTPAQVIEQAYLRTVSRRPTDDEVRQGVAFLEAAESPLDGARDLLWALINTKEFIVNH